MHEDAPPPLPQPPNAPLVVLMGPTAAGKSHLAQAVALEAHAEIISCDAVSVYRGFDVGAAKPDAAARAAVPHHLIDVVDATEPFDAQRYLTAADAVLAKLWARGGVPLLCGGTGLYVRALRQGLIDAPHDAALRVSLEADDARTPGTSLGRLAELDPPSAAAIDPHNGHYVRRALEICLLTGQPASALRRAHAAQPPRLAMHIFVVDLPDAVLRGRIGARVGAMLRQGLIDEVAGLRARGVPPTAKPMLAVGYREVAAYLDGTLARGDLEAAIAQSTWQYARRQRIWLRREAREAPEMVTWLPCDDAPRAQATLVAALGAKAA